jgi:NTE family protein
MAEKKKKTINLALQGGGAHGAFAWGVIDYFLESGVLDFSGICATSAGSMNATVFAYNHAKYKGDREKIREGLHNFWQDISKSTFLSSDHGNGLFSKHLRNMNYSVMDIMSHIMSPYQFNPANLNMLRDILQKNVDFEELNKFKDVKLFISATNVRTGKVKVFSTEEICINVVMASACLPYLFQAVKVGDDYYWDGGFTGNPAIFPLFYEKNCSNDVLVVHINPIVRSKLPTEPGEIMNRMNEITFNSSLISEYRAIAFVNKMLNEGWLKDEYKDKVRHIRMHAIRADLALQGFDVSNKFDTHWENLSHLKSLGRIEAKKWVESCLDMVGKHSTVDLEKFVNQVDHQK